MPSHIALVLTFMIMSQLSSSISMKNRGLLRPALKRPTLIDPKASTTAFTAAALSSRLVTSILTAIALPFPAALIRSATTDASDSSRSPRHTLAPCAAKFSALAAPMPRAAPVIRIFLPLRRLGSMVSSLSDLLSHYVLGPRLRAVERIARRDDPAQHIVKFVAADADDVRDLRNRRARPELQFVAPRHLVHKLEDR